MALPLVELLVALLSWALRAFAFVLGIKALENVSVHITGLSWLWAKIRGGIVAAIHGLEQDLARFALGAEGATAEFFYRTAALVDDFAWSGFNTAARMLGALEILTTATIPNYVEGLVRPVVRVVHTTQRVAGKTVTRVERVAVAGAHSVDATWARATRALALSEQALQHSVAGTLPRALPWTSEQIGFTRKQLRRILRRIRALPDWLTVAGVSAVSVYALTRIGAGWLRCSNWQKIGKTGCRMPSRWLDDVLGLLADFAVISNACLVIPWLERAASEVGVPLVEALTHLGAGVCRGTTRPAPLPLPMPALPPVVNVAALTGLG